jgi:hypothetical protein
MPRQELLVSKGIPKGGGARPLSDCRTRRSNNAGHVSLEQLKVMSAIENCRTAELAVLHRHRFGGKTVELKSHHRFFQDCARADPGLIDGHRRKRCAVDAQQ